VYGEVEEYIRQMTNYSTLHRIFVRQLAAIRPLSITRTIMDRYADLRLRMRPPHGSGVLTDSDTLIAATATRYSLVLVTHDSRDFSRLPGLQTLLLTSR
jgi:predicted nucleic acid-binding protein